MITINQRSQTVQTCNIYRKKSIAYLHEVYFKMEYDSLVFYQPELVATFHHTEKIYKYKTTVLNQNKMKSVNWKIRIEYMTPEARNSSNLLKVYC